MPKQAITIPFSDFSAAAGTEHDDFIATIHTFLQDCGCIYKIKTAANGYVVSYVHKPTNRTVANYVFRKNLPMLRVYADNVQAYEDIINSLPKTMKDTIKQGGNCSRLINPNACNSRCLQGFDFVLDGERQQKCRCHMSFTFFLTEETKPYLKEMVKHEMQNRTHDPTCNQPLLGF